jgi:hypothetical protein
MVPGMINAGGDIIARGRKLWSGDFSDPADHRNSTSQQRQQIWITWKRSTISSARNRYSNALEFWDILLLSPRTAKVYPEPIDDWDKMVGCYFEAIRYHCECGDFGGERMRGAGGSMTHSMLCHLMANYSCFGRLFGPVWIV